MNCFPWKMESSEPRDLGYHTQQFVHARQRDAGSGFVLTPTGGLRVCIPPGGSTSSQYVSGGSEAEYVPGGPKTQVFRVGPRYNASVMSANTDRRGSVDSGMAHVIRLGAAGASPQVFRIRGGAGSGGGYIEQQPNQTSRVVHIGGVGRVETQSNNNSAPGHHQVIRIGPQGVRVTPAGNGSPPARVYRVVPFAVPVSDDGQDQPLPAPQSRVIPGFGDYQSSSATGHMSPPVGTSATSQPRLVRYTMNPASFQPALMTSSADSTSIFVNRGQPRWRDAADATDQTGCGGFIPGVGAVYRCRPRETGNGPATPSSDRFQPFENQSSFKTEAAPPLSAIGRTGSAGETSIGSPSFLHGNDDTMTSQAYELDAPRRFRIRIGGDGDDGGSPLRQCNPIQQQPAVVASTQPYSYPARGDGSGSPAIQTGHQLDRQPTFTVRSVGQFGSDGRPITDFGELICESIRQFLAHKQQVGERSNQQQQQQQLPRFISTASSSNSSAVPRRVTQEFNCSRSQSPLFESAASFDRSRDGSPSVVVAGHGYSSPPSTMQRSTPPGSVTPEDRNLFQKYKFQFESIGDFGRSNSRDDISGDNGGTGSGSWSKIQQQPQPLSQTGPIAVFCFQDFDDMVAKMREMREGIPPPAPAAQFINAQQHDVTRPGSTTDTWRQHQLPRQLSGQNLRATSDNRLPNRKSFDCEDDDGEDSGYHTANSSQLTTLTRGYGGNSQHVSAAATVTNSPAHRSAVSSREQLRHRIAAFNSNNRGFIISLEKIRWGRPVGGCGGGSVAIPVSVVWTFRCERILDQHSDVYHGIIRVHMNLIRPVQMTLASEPSLLEQHSDDEQSTMSNEVTTFHLPKDTTKVIHISSETTTKEVIRTLLSKFRIRDNPRKFALYEKFDGTGTSEMRRLGDNELPLPLCLGWAERGSACLENYTFILQENDTGEILWEAFSLPELENFLMILNKEEEEYLQQITQTYRLLKIHFQHRIKELKKDRIGPGARLQQNTTLQL